MTALSWAYAVLGALCALSNVVAWRSAAPQRWATAFVDFVFGWFPSEAPGVSLLGQGLLVGVAGVAGVFVAPPVGALQVAVWVVLVLHLLSAAGLAHQWLLGRAVAASALASARHTLGDAGWPAARFPRTPAAVAERGPHLWRVGGARRRYAVDRDLSYGPHRANQLDLWRLPDTGAHGPAPVIVHVPGGAWVYGDRRHQGYALLSHLVERGWIGVSIQYRLAPRHRWPAHLEDVAAALTWVRTHIGEHGGDPGHLVITGGSAGGHLAALAGLLGEREVGRHGQVMPAVQAVVANYPMTDWTGALRAHRSTPRLLTRMVVGQPYTGHEELYAAASPLSQVHAQAPLFVVTHGTNDEMIPVEHSDRFVAALREVSTSPVVYLRLPRAHHGFDIYGSARTRGVVAAVGDVLGSQWARTHPDQSRL